MAKTTKNLSAKQLEELIATLKTRFEKHTKRHKGIEWEQSRSKVKS